MYNNNYLYQYMFPSYAFISQLRFTFSVHNSIFLHINQQCISTCKELSENITGAYSSQLLWLKEVLKDMVFWKDTSPSPLEEASSIDQQEDEGVLKRTLSTTIELTDILLRISKQGDRGIASELVDWLTDASFEINIFKLYRESLVNCKDVFTRRTVEVIKDDVF